MRRSIVSVLAILAVAGCSQFGFGKGGNGGLDAGGGGGGGFGQNGVNTSALDPASNPASAAYFQQTVGDRVLFAVDQSTINGAGSVVLDGQSVWLKTNPSFQIVIEGHADEQGTREYNLALGARRANAVKEYLISRGVSASRIKTLTYGKERPIEICSTEACYTLNRRAVTILSGG